MSDARASTPRLSRSTRIAHCPGPIRQQPLCRGARPIGIMKKPDEVTIIPEGGRYQPGRSWVLDRGHAYFRALRQCEVRRISLPLGWMRMNCRSARYKRATTHYLKAFASAIIWGHGESKRQAPSKGQA